MSSRPALWPQQHTKSDPRQKGNWTKPELRLVEGGKQGRQFRLSPRRRLAALSTLVVVMLFGVIGFHVILSQQSFRLEELNSRADDAQDQYERNRYVVAQLESPQRVIDDAQNRLGFVAPDKITAVSPDQADMPRGTSPGSDMNAPSTSSTVNSGSEEWMDVKSQLSSTAQ